jgi:hypothetical protein
MSGCFSFIALAALSRKKALIVEPISRTWRNNSSYSSGRNFTVTRTVSRYRRVALCPWPWRRHHPAGCSADGPQAVSPLTAAKDARTANTDGSRKMPLADFP